MPAIRIKPSRNAKKRDFWGDADRGRLFEEQIDNKFGTHFGSRKDALKMLKLQRRLFNMYITGERAIPDDVWSALRAMPKYKTPVKPKLFIKPSAAAPKLLYVDDIDPLS